MIESFNAIRYPRSTLVPLVLWVLTMISLPILGWILGEGYLIRGMALGVLMQASAVLLILYFGWGWAGTLKTFAIVVTLSFLAEFAGSTSGLPFGKYHYTGLLQPQLGGVPLLIPLAWMMMLPPAWAIAKIILGKSGRRWAFVLLSALAFSAWDLFLDPQMVGWGFWVWETPGAYFGIPLSNYLGWIVVSALLTLAVNPQDLPLGPLALVYVLTWLLQSIGQGIFWGQPGPAIVGFLGSGFFVLLAFWQSRSQPAAQSDD